MAGSAVHQIARKLASCPGVKAVVLGGSRASGTADASSDIDIGLYYEKESPLDLSELSRLVAAIDDRGIEGLVTGFGDWGPWVNGGGWLLVRGQRLDLIYRELNSVRRAIEDCRAGHIKTHFQVGHPAGFSPQIYAGEIHFCKPLHDPDELIRAMKRMTHPYPPALKHALIQGLWEAGFVLETAASSASRGDLYHVSGCAYRSVVCIVQALFGLNESYWVNEKRALEKAAHLPVTLEDFGPRARRCLGELGTEPTHLQESLKELRILLDDVQRLIDPIR